MRTRHPRSACTGPFLRRCATLCLLGLGGAVDARAAAAPAAAAAPEAVAAQLRDAALAGHNIAYQWVSELTSHFGPRPAGSVNELQAGGRSGS